MKIVCGKCGNEFVFREEGPNKNVYMVQCPVCRNPVMIKNTDRQIQHSRGEKNKERRYRDHREMRAGRRQSVTGEKNGYENSMVDMEGDFYEGENAGGFSKPIRITDLIDRLKRFMRSADFSRLGGKYLPYIYYPLALFFIFTTLFLFSDLMRLYPMHTTTISMLVHSILLDFKHI